MAANREDLEIENIRSGIEKTRAEITKMMAETAKINSENKYYPMIATATVTATVIGVIIALTKLFL